MNVRVKNDLKQWFKFFLVGIIETAKNSITTFDNILKLKKEIEEKIQGKSSRNHRIFKLMDNLYQKPVINAKQVVKILEISDATAYKILNDMEDLGILNEITGNNRD